MATFNGETLTKEAIEKTHKHFAGIYQGCIDEVKSGDVRVNCPESYFAENEKRRDAHLNKIASVTNFTFLQRAYYIQTGKMVALLP